MAADNMITNPLTQADIAQYRKLIETEGARGIDKVYDDMIRRGYHSAIWNKHEYARDTDFGLNNVNLMMQQNGIGDINRNSQINCV